jgi:hypothetical protein
MAERRMAERRRQTQAAADRQSAHPLGGISHCRSSVLSDTPSETMDPPWTPRIHSAVGFRVTAIHNSCRRPSPRTRNANSC